MWKHWCWILFFGGLKDYMMFYFQLATNTSSMISTGSYNTSFFISNSRSGWWFETFAEQFVLPRMMIPVELFLFSGRVETTNQKQSWTELNDMIYMLYYNIISIHISTWIPAENYIYQRKAKHWGWKKVICLVEYGFPCSKLLWLGRNPSAVNLNFWAQQEEHVYGWYRLWIISIHWYRYRPGINQFYQNTPLNVISFATYFGHTPTVFNSPRVILLASCKCCRLQPMFMGEIYYSWIESLRECYTAIQYTPCMEHLQYEHPKNSRVTLP